MSGKRYTLTEDAYITANWQTTTDAEMGAALDRPVNSIGDRRTKLGLSRRKVPALREGRSYAAGARPSPPKGMTPAQVLWAKMHPEHREAGLIQVFHAEGPQGVPA